MYNPKGTKLPLPRIVELNRRLVKGYERYKDDPRIKELKQEVLAYNRKLLALNIRDHQVQYARMNMFKAGVIFWYRLFKLLVLTIFVLPGTVLFGAVFVACKFYSVRKAREALAASNVKIQARDVMATWKLLVAMAVAPLTYTLYIFIFTYWYSTNHIQGYLPAGIRKRWLVLAQSILFPTVTYAALRFGEVAMDIFKSLWPLLKVMFANDEIVKLQQRREHVAQKVNDIINTLGPEMFDDFHSKRIVKDSLVTTPPRTPSLKTDAEATEEAGQSVQTYDFPVSPSDANHDQHPHLPRNESFKDLANQDFFSTRPSTPKRARSRSGSSQFGGFQLKPFSTITGKDGLDEVSRRIKHGMRDRATRRGSTDEWDTDSVPSTPGTPKSERSEGLTMTKKNR